MNITKLPIKAKQISFLNEANTLYSCDFRSIGESIEYKIPAMWKYENLIPWIVIGKHVLVNNSKGAKFTEENQLIHLEADRDPRVSIYQRARNVELPSKIDKLWVAVPHPDADLLAKEKNYQ